MESAIDLKESEERNTGTHVVRPGEMRYWHQVLCPLIHGINL